MSFFKSLAFSVITRRDLTLTLWPFSEPIKLDKVGDLEHIEVVAANKDLIIKQGVVTVASTEVWAEEGGRIFPAILIYMDCCISHL